MNLRLLSLAALLGATVTSQAALTWHTTLASWNTASGGATRAEDFSSFGADTEYRTQDVGIVGGVLRQVGTNGFRNEIDVPATLFPDNNGTAHASMFSEFSGSIGARLTFDALQKGFGLQTWDAASGETSRMEVYNGASLLGSQVLTGGAGDFLGFTLSGADVATHILLVAAADDSINGEGFGTDNYVYQTIPEPATVTLIGFGVAALLARRRK